MQRACLPSWKWINIIESLLDRALETEFSGFISSVARNLSLRIMASAAEKPVWLGLPGDFVDESADAYVTKIGGTPILPAAMSVSGLGDIKCGLCSRPLTLLCQVWDGWRLES